MSSPEDLGIETGSGLVSVPGADPAPCSPRWPRDTWLHIGFEGLAACDELFGLYENRSVSSDARDAKSRGRGGQGASGYSHETQCQGL